MPKEVYLWVGCVSHTNLHPASQNVWGMCPFHTVSESTQPWMVPHTFYMADSISPQSPFPLAKEGEGELD